MKKFLKILALILAFSLIFSTLASCDLLPYLEDIITNEVPDEPNDETPGPTVEKPDNAIKVTFVYDIDQIEVVYTTNNIVQLPTAPTKDGYAFDGWYYEDGIIRVGGTIVYVEKDTVLYAHWTPVTPGNNNGGSNDGGNNGNPVVEYDGSEVTITFYHTMGQRLQIELYNAIARFNKIYPNITIEHQQVGGYDDVRDTVSKQLTVGNQPNIAYCFPDHVALYNLTGKVVPLNNFIESTLSDGIGGQLGFTQQQIDNFIDGFYAEGSMFDEAGTMYTLPMVKSTEVMYYNKTFFEQHNLKVPTTWAELEEVCAQIKAIDPDCTPFGYDSEANWFITMCEQYGSGYTSNGEDKFLYNNPTNRAFVKMFREWFDKGYFTTQEIYGAYTSALFVNQQSYICIGSSAGAAHNAPGDVDGVAPFEMGVAPIPQVDPSKPKAISQGPSLVIFDQENKQEVVASWLFVKFLTTDCEFQATFSQASGYIPVIEKEVLVEAIPTYGTWLASGAPIPTAINVALSQQDAYFIPPAFNGSSKARDAVGALMRYCFTTPATDIEAMILQAFKDSVDDCEYYF